ncbi:MAG: phenylacetate--CoA ligase family protein [Desulfobacteraceae bacterium]|nr:phenylacetate--CoA ligase family protein [Desulfobacteraceae bacterium]
METFHTWVLLRHLRAGLQRSPGDIRQLQDRLLRDAVSHAYKNVPFYRKFWDKSGFDANNFRGIQDLNHIPIMTNSMVKESARQGELLALGVDTDKCTYLDSSGSSGNPLRVWKQPLEERLRRAIGLRIFFEHGFRWNHMTVQFQILPGPSHFLQQFGISKKKWISTEQPIQEQLNQFLEAKAGVVVGTSTALRQIALAVEASNEKFKRPLIVFCAGELLDLETCTAVKRVFKVDPTGLYGQTEVGYMAWQCEQRSAFHINADTHLVEVVLNGQQVGPGELGAIVITDLRARTMPFIRYDTTDLAIAGLGQCSCGRSFPVLESIEGRTKSSVLLKDGRILTTRALVNHMAGTLCLGEYRLHQLTLHRFRLELISDFASVDRTGVQDMSTQDLKTTALRRLHKILGDVEISVKFVKPWQPDGTGKTHTIASSVPIAGLSSA